MSPTKTNSSRQRVKRSRKHSSTSSTNENTGDVHHLMIIEQQEILHSSLEQPLPHVIDQSTSYSSTNQPSSLSPQSINSPAPALGNHSSSSLVNL